MSGQSPNMYIYETHLHTDTVSACAKSTPAEQVHAYKNRGYTGIIITDHFLNGHAHKHGGSKWSEKVDFFASSYKKAKAEGDKVGLDVFFGWEYSIRGSDFLTYGLDIDFLLEYPQLENTVSIDEYSLLVRKHGGYLAQAHPFREGTWILEQKPVSPSLIDGVEVHNGSMTYVCNKKAMEFAKKHALPMQAGSDSHDAFLHYEASGVKMPNKAMDIFDIIRAIKSFSVELII